MPFLFYKDREQKGKTGPVVGAGRIYRKEVRG
jgi:hypothetical protein